MLTRVTITGADDRTDPRALVALSCEFPFVEWGILHSAKRSGQARYPSVDWRGRFDDARDVERVDVAVHLCGSLARRSLSGDLYVNPLPACANRIQLNGWEPGAYTPALYEWSRSHGVEFVLQVRTVDALQDAADEAAAISSASALFDPSGGRGLEGFSYPVTPFGLRLGFAGGIGPDNVLDVIRAIGPRGAPYWIDMESHVRTDDVLDLAKVRRVLELAAPFTAMGAG